MYIYAPENEKLTGLAKLGAYLRAFLTKGLYRALTNEAD
jgi:hypothetical protein